MIKNKRLTLFAFVFLIVVLLWAIWGNSALQSNVYIIESAALPPAFDGWRIAQVSDLHNASFGSGNQKLLSLLRQTSPDIIVITGDMVDSRRTDIGSALNFAAEAVKIAPCYYVSGNHEARIDDYHKLEEGLITAGVTALCDESVSIEKNGEKILLIGAEDPGFIFTEGDDVYALMHQKLASLASADSFSILLSHRPEFFSLYCESSFDLVFSGHAHGGQFRLPFIGGLFAPGQGFLPEYDSGVFCKDSTQMVVSRGLGNSLFPLRLNNCPEIVVAELRAV